MKENNLGRNLLWGNILLITWLVPAFAEGPMASQYRANQYLNSCQATEKIADFLVDQHRVTDANETGWTWFVGEKNLSANMAGLVSLALLDAYQAIDKPAYLLTAERQAEVFFQQTDCAFPYKSDIELLMRLGDFIQNPAYEKLARELFSRIQSRSKTPALELARIFTGRKATPALVGYDASLATRAALSVDDRSYAYSLVDALIEQMHAWYLPESDARFSLISAAALVPVLQRLDEARYSPIIGHIRSQLIRFQSANGSWLNNETQVTVHAAHSLLFSPLANEREAAKKGIAWLISTLLSSGSLATYNDYMPEPLVGQVFSGVNAEALALFSADCSTHQE